MKAPFAVWLAFLVTVAIASTGFILLEDEQNLAAPDRETREGLDLLQHPDPAVRRQAAEALGAKAVHAGDVVPALTKALRDPEPAVRLAAAHALGSMGAEARDALPALTQTMADPHQEVLEEAIRAIRQIENARPIPVVAEPQ